MQKPPRGTGFGSAGEGTASGDKVALRIEGHARHTGALELAPGSRLPATNRTFRMEIAEFLTDLVDDVEGRP